jgi:threonine aldolase
MFTPLNLYFYCKYKKYKSNAKINRMEYIDLRSDTVTKPTLEMRTAIFTAIVGDDVYGEDPTVIALQNRVASMFCKEAALFFPTGTMCNLAAILGWCPARGGEVILGDNSHIFLFEQSGMAQFGGVSPRTIPNLEDGTIDIEKIRLAIRDDDIHEPATKLICIENTHNACGGKVIPVDYLKSLKDVVETRNIPIHMDGARIWNAATNSGIKLSEYGKYADSISVCLSKGLGAPAGSLLVASNEMIQRVRRIRKALGGGMRQVGILAAAGLRALDDFESGVLKMDHVRSRYLANVIRELPGFRLREPVETNMLFIDILYNTQNKPIAEKVSILFKERGILVSNWAPFLIRLTVHRDIGDKDIEKTIQVLREISELLYISDTV